MDEGLDKRIRPLWERARAAWPQFEVSLDAFGTAARALLDDAPQEPERWAELYLACGCAAADRRALERFETVYVAVVPAAVRRFDLDGGDVDEVRQAVRQRLLLTDDGAPRLLRYAGRGSLRGLVRITATRIAIDLLRSRQGPAAAMDSDDLLRLPVGADDPELAAIKAEFRSEFRMAFEHAMASLTARQRTVLRLHLIDGVPLQKLATSYGANRSTVVRWIAAAKAELLRSTLRSLSELTSSREAEMQSFIRLIRSRMDLSVRRVLGRD